MPTTIRDYANDLVEEAIEKREAKEAAGDAEPLTWEELKDDLIADFIKTIRERILG